MSFWAAGGVDERIGTKVGDYEIESLVGVGGMGMVYEAISSDGGKVALKIVKPDVARDRTFRRRFSREAEIARTVRNPHLVAVLDTGEHEGLPYMAEQFIDGSSLDDKLKAEGRLDVQTTVTICSEVAEGLEALWAAGMVHRDIKPGNILLDRGGTAYVTDFGLAKNTQGSVLTEPGQALGSLDYMSPEQIRGEEVTGAADIYSLGCVVYECLQGRPPFGDRTGLRVLWAHLQEEPPDCVGRADLSSAFVQTLKAALAKTPEERPVSGSDYIVALSRAAGLDLCETSA